MTRTDIIKVFLIRLSTLVDSGKLSPIDEFRCMEMMIKLDGEIMQ